MTLFAAFAGHGELFRRRAGEYRANALWIKRLALHRTIVAPTFQTLTWSDHVTVIVYRTTEEALLCNTTNKKVTVFKLNSTDALPTLKTKSHITELFLTFLPCMVKSPRDFQTRYYRDGHEFAGLRLL